MKQQTVTYKDVDEAQGARLRSLYRQVFGEDDRSKGKAETLKAKIKAELDRRSQRQPKAPGKKRPPEPAVVDSPDHPGWGYKEDRGEFWVVEKETENELGPYDTAEQALEAIRETHSQMRRQLQRKDTAEAQIAEREASKAARAAEKAARVAEKAAEKVERAAGTASASKAGVSAETKEAAPSEAKKKDRDGSGAYIRAAIMAGGKSPSTIVEEVHNLFPGAKTTPKEVYWYRWDLKGKGHKPPNWPAQPNRQSADARKA